VKSAWSLVVTIALVAGCADAAPDPNPMSEATVEAGGQGPQFHGYLCTQDCSGHEAGYRWAQEKGIEHPDDCGGRSQSFIEGCQAYAHELNAQRIEDGECDDEDEDGLCDQ